MSGARQTILELAEPECAAEVIGDEVVVLNITSGVYFSLRGLAAGIWRDLAAGWAVEQLADAHAAACGDDGAPVRSLVGELRQHGLLRPSPPRPVAGEPAIAGQLGDGESEIIFDVFEDMRDLLLADPIHDADETQGWPATKSS